MELHAFHFSIELSDQIFIPGQRQATLMLGKYPVFTETVYDNELRSAEENLMLLFSEKMRRLLEDE